MVKFIKALALVLRVGPDEILRSREEAIMDPLTGLLNRRGLLCRLNSEKARSDRYDRPFLLVYVDLDGLKQINDTLGYHEGDQALILLAEMIKKNIRSADFAGRIGGDEFVIVFPETTEKEGILNRLSTMIGGVSSIGYYHYCGPVLLDDALKQAETGMREDKRKRKTGRD